MSKLKVAALQGLSASSDAITLANDGTCTANITNNLSNRNVVMNGEFQVAQRGTSFTNIGSGGGGTSGYDDTFTLDRFLISQGLSAGRCSVTQENDAPSGFSKSLKIATTTADTSTAAGEYHRLLTKFEGQDLQRFAKGTSDAKQFTLSFYCKANASATYVAELHDTDNDRSISKTFSVTTSWTRVKLTFAADTTGAFNNDNLLSMTLALWFHAGSTYSSGTLQTNWGSMTAANRAVGIDSIFDSTNRTFFITGVQLEVGSVATDFEHRSFGDELNRCFRYYEQFNSNGLTETHFASGYFENDTTAKFCLLYTRKRAAPTITASAASTFTSLNTGSIPAATGLSIHKQTERAAEVRLTVPTISGANGQSCILISVSSTEATIKIDSEL